MHFFRVDVFIPSLIARLIVVGNVLVVVLDLLDREKSAVHPVIPVLGLRPADKYDNVSTVPTQPTKPTVTRHHSFVRYTYYRQNDGPNAISESSTQPHGQC